MAARSTIVVTMPSRLRYRDLAVRTLTAACHLVDKDAASVEGPDTTSIDLHRSFDSEFISAFSEIFNNISIHAYEGSDEGEIRIEITPSSDRLVVEITDHGKSFDINNVPTPALDELPEGGMGIHIARACLDELSYTPGSPNTWRLSKQCSKNGTE